MPLSQADLTSIAQMTGCDEASLPEGFVEEYETQIKMQHRLQSGPMELSTLINLCRQFELGEEAPKPPPEKIDWGKVKIGTRVRFRKKGRKLYNGVFKGKVADGTISVMPVGESEALELSPTVVVMGKEPEKPPERDSHSVPRVDWSSLAVGCNVTSGKQTGKLLRYRAENAGGTIRPAALIVDIDGQEVEFKPEESRTH